MKDESEKNMPPKIIWIMWLQGFKHTPHVVQQCVKSWQKHNQSWEIVLLDEENVNEYIDIRNVIGKNIQYISKQALSDIVRINLLKMYGGVWVDATCFCCMPLDSWLHKYTGSGLFAFDRPGVDRPISSWFLASSKNSILTEVYCDEVNRYWSENCFSNQNNKIGEFVDVHLQERIKQTDYEAFQFRVLFYAIKFAKVFPYFWFHYIFSIITTKNGLCGEKWKSAIKFSADIPHALQHIGLFNPISDDIKSRINQKEAPLYKLTWKYNENQYTNDCVLKYLFEH